MFSQDFISYLTSKITPAVLQQHNLKLSIVGCGDWELIKPYRDSLGTPFEIYSDPTKDSYVSSLAFLYLPLYKLTEHTRLM